MKHLKFLCSAGALAMAFAAWAAGPSGTLPVIYINTEGGVAVPSKHEPYVKATYYVEPNGTPGVEAIGSKEKPLALQIRGRGNYTWTGFDKKPYKLKLDKKAAMLGMNKSKHWGLLAHADDNQGFMRNVSGFKLSELFGLPWTPAHQPCEVVLNGSYDGLYFLTELVRVDKDRVNVTSTDDAVEDWLDANPGSTADQYPWTDVQKTGGWLVEIDNYDDDDQIKVPTRQTFGDGPQVIRVTYDTPSDYITPAQKQWLYDEFDTIDRLIFTGDKDKCEWAEKVDLTNLAKFFLVNQIVGNYESFHGSCKLSREQGTDTKWNFGPVWDFGSAFQDSWSPTKYIWISTYLQHWIEEMYSYPALQAEVKRLYAEFMDADGMKALYAFQDEMAQTIAAAARADAERWPQYGNSDVAARKNHVQDILRTSISYLNRELGYTPVHEIEAPSSAIYLRGEPDWDARPERKFTDQGNGDYTLRLASLSGKFKLAGPEWSVGNVDFGGASAMKLDTPATLTFGGSDITLSEPLTDVTLIFNWPRKELTITHEMYSGITDITDTDADAPAEYYTLQGVRVASPTAGLYIVVRQGKVTKEYLR